MSIHILGYEGDIQVSDNSEASIRCNMELSLLVVSLAITYYKDHDSGEKNAKRHNISPSQMSHIIYIPSELVKFTLHSHTGLIILHGSWAGTGLSYQGKLSPKL